MNFLDMESGECHALSCGSRGLKAADLAENDCANTNHSSTRMRERLQAETTQGVRQSVRCGKGMWYYRQLDGVLSESSWWDRCPPTPVRPAKRALRAWRMRQLSAAPHQESGESATIPSSAGR